MILVLELQDAMDKLDWCVNKVTYEVVVHHDVPNKEDGYIVIEKPEIPEDLQEEWESYLATCESLEVKTFSAEVPQIQ